MELTITKERVLEAADACPTAHRILKKLFPEAFEVRFYRHKIYAFRTNDGKIYKLHRSVGSSGWSWVRIGNSDMHSNGRYSSPADALEALSNHKVFDNEIDFYRWALDNSK